MTSIVCHLDRFRYVQVFAWWVVPASQAAIPIEVGTRAGTVPARVETGCLHPGVREPRGHVTVLDAR